MRLLLGSQDGREDPTGTGVEGEFLQVAILYHLINQELHFVIMTELHYDLAEEAEILTGHVTEGVGSQVLPKFFPAHRAQVWETSEGYMSPTSSVEERVEDTLVLKVS